MAIATEEFKARRDQLLAKMGEGVAVIPTAPEVVRNRDSHYPYRFDSYFYYLTGFEEPESVLILIAGENPRSIIFCRNKDLEREIWDGFRYGPEATAATFGFDNAHAIDQLDEMMPNLLGNQSAIYFSLGADSAWDQRMAKWLSQLRAGVRSGVQVPSQLSDVRKLLDQMRVVKRPYEIALMQRSADIAAAAHNRAMAYVGKREVDTEKYEYQVEAEFLHAFTQNGAPSPAYTSIVAGGANACTLHYNANNARLNNGELLLIDAGCEYAGYASDITRTFPVSGQFSAAQKDVYELVLAAQKAAIEAVSPAAHWNTPHEAALEVLAQGFIDLGLCDGTKEAVIESGSYRQFYMHRTGHWLGLDVHDAGEYKDTAGNWQPLVSGHVLTVEPGCYIRPADNVPEAFWNIGVRIEDDVLITASGCDVLTQAAVKSVTDIEALMRG